MVRNLYFDLRRIVLTFLVFDNFSLPHALMFQTTSRFYRHLMLLLMTLILNLSSWRRQQYRAYSLLCLRNMCFSLWFWMCALIYFRVVYMVINYSLTLIIQSSWTINESCTYVIDTWKTTTNKWKISYVYIYWHWCLFVDLIEIAFVHEYVSWRSRYTFIVFSFIWSHSLHTEWPPLLQYSPVCPRSSPRGR